MTNLTPKDLIDENEPLEPETLSFLFPGYTDLEKEMIQVFKVVKHTDYIFVDMDVFENAVAVVNGVSPNPFNMEGSKPEWIWKAVNIFSRLRSERKYEHEVKKYCKYIFNDNGIYFYPKELGIKDNELLNEVVENSKKDKKLKENFLDIQTYHYFRFKHYMEE